MGSTIHSFTDVELFVLFNSKQALSQKFCNIMWPLSQWLSEQFYFCITYYVVKVNLGIDTSLNI